MTATLAERATRLRALHAEGALVLPNAWDAASAALPVPAGAGGEQRGRALCG